MPFVLTSPRVVSLFSGKAVTGEIAVVMVVGTVDRSPHPLLRPDALSQALADIASSAAPTALIDLIRWLDSFHYEEPLPALELARLVVLLDEAAQPHLRQATDLYLSNVSCARSMRYKALGRDFHASLGRAYELALAALPADAPDPLLSEVLLRSVRCANGEMKWAAFDYQDISGDAWRRAGEAYRKAHELNRLDKPVLIREGRETRSTIRREFVRLVAMHSACLDQLIPERIEATDKLVRHLQYSLELRQEPGKGSLFAVDLETLAPPRRCLAMPAGPSAATHYFSPVEAIPVLDELGRSIAGSRRDFAGLNGTTVSAAIHHLARHWAAQPPTRQYRRHPVGGELALATGLGFIRSLISGGALLKPAAAWTMLDASRNGFGVEGAMLDPEVCRIGALLAAHMGGDGRWVLGVVRRVRLREGGGVYLGVQRIANNPQPIVLDDGRRSWSGILCDPAVRGRAVRIVCEPGLMSSEGPVFAKLGPRMCKLKPSRILSSGPGFQVIGCQVT